MIDPITVVEPNDLAKFLEYTKPLLVLDKIVGTSPYVSRYMYESWLKNNGRYESSTHPLSDLTKEGLRKWIEEVEELEKTKGMSRIEMDVEMGMQAYWSEIVPLTEEERKEAEDWLEANPKKEGETIRIKFRSPLSTKENE